MDIRIGKYRLTANADNIIIYEVNTIKDGEKKGQEIDTKPGYYGSVVNALDALLKRKIKDSDATTLEQLKTEIREHRKQLSVYLGETV